MKLRADEAELVGKWRRVGDTIEADSTARRIDRLIEDQLEKLGADSSGWDVLYKDPGDGRLWELSYPNSESEGGGPPRLTLITEEAARAKYGGVVSF